MRLKRKQTFQCAGFFICAAGSHPSGAGRATLAHGMPRFFHSFLHAAGVQPSSSSVTPGWKPHDGQISYEPPPDFAWGVSFKCGQWQAGQRCFMESVGCEVRGNSRQVFRMGKCGLGDRADGRNNRGCLA